MLLDNIDELLLKKIKSLADNMVTKMEYEKSVFVSTEDRPINITYGEPEVSLEAISIPISYGSEYDKNLQEEYILPNAKKR